MFDVDSLLLERAILETRFERGYLYWDNCGKIWNELTSKFPELEAVTISPQEAKLKYKNENIEVSFSANSLNISQQYPSNLKTFSEISDEAFTIITRLLQIETLTRIGNRFFYVAQVNNSEESIEIIKKLGCFNGIKERVSMYGDKIINPHLSFTVTKADEKGYIVNISHLERTLDISLPKIVKYDTSQFFTKVLQIDIDFYTMKPVDCSIVKSSELIKKNERDINHLMKEIFK